MSRPRSGTEATARSGLATDGGPDIGIAMKTAPRDAGQQVVEGVFRRPRRSQDEVPLPYGSLDGRVLADADFESEILGNAECEVVAPPLGPGVRASVLVQLR